MSVTGTRARDQLALFHVVSMVALRDEFHRLCRDCSADTGAVGERYMVHHDVWPVEPDGGVLCVGCLETRIGRRLVPADFTDCLGNRGYWRRSPRLEARLNGGTRA